MLGAIIGDVIGSRFEWHPTKSKDFELFRPECRFTDDTVMTVAISEALVLSRTESIPLEESAVEAMRNWGRSYPNAGYGRGFRAWLESEKPVPYRSYGNGAAMRVSPVGWAACSLEEALQDTEAVTACTHNDPDGLNGAKAVAGALFLARSGATKERIRTFVQDYYPMDFTIEEIRPDYRFDSSCKGSVPQAITAFLESESFEDAIRTAISLGGDADTMADIAGALGEAFYGVPPYFELEVQNYLTAEFVDRICNFQSVFSGQCPQSLSVH